MRLPQITTFDESAWLPHLHSYCICGAAGDKAQMIVNENEAEKLFEMRMEEKKNMKDLKTLACNPPNAMSKLVCSSILEPRRIFQVLDEDGSGQVTTEEFDAAFEIPECRRCVQIPLVVFFPMT